jgi:hypothetical protein
MIVTMSRAGSPLKRLIAALLPMSLVWMFVACASICARESADEHSNNRLTGPIEIKDSSDCRGCPLTAFPKATIPERAIHSSDLQTQVLLNSLVQYSAADDFADGLRQREHSSAHPPLTRLPVLRI